MTDRITIQRYDFDHNDVYEGLSEFLYDTSGRIIEVRYTYTDDGEADRDYERTNVNRGNVNSTTTYQYDAQGRLASLAETADGERVSIAYTYNDDGLIVRSDAVWEDVTGAVTNSRYYLLEYENQRLVQYSAFSPDEAQPTERIELAYDQSGRVETNRIIPSLDIDEGSISFFYQTNDRLETVSVVPPMPPQLGYETHTFTYNEIDRLATYEKSTLPNSDEGYYRQTYRYDDSGRLIESLLDNQIDGSVDVVVQTEWEQGVCTPVVIWEQRGLTAMKADTQSPYLPGTGYRYIPVCDTGEF
jgi:hypothetical protein